MKVMLLRDLHVIHIGLEINTRLHISTVSATVAVVGNFLPYSVRPTTNLCYFSVKINLEWL